MKYSQSLRPRIVPNSPAIGQESSQPVRNPATTIPMVPNSHAQMIPAFGQVSFLKLTPYHGCGSDAHGPVCGVKLNITDRDGCTRIGLSRRGAADGGAQAGRPFRGGGGVWSVVFWAGG